MRVTDSTEGPVLEEANGPQPVPGNGELLIRVYAAGVTRTELGWYPTSHSKTGEKRTGAVPGHEFSGVVAAMGKNVADASLGQEVYGMNDWFEEGATAEYCLTRDSSVAIKPSWLSHIEAAAVPISALTAWQGLFDKANVQAGERVLVQGGAGGVGMFAVQLARWKGAHVVATASASNLEFVRQLGAETVIDHHADAFEDHAGTVDVVFDTVGGETRQRSWSILKPGGRLVTIASDGEAVSDERTKQAFFIVEPNRQQLTEIGNLLEKGLIRLELDAVLPFSQADKAYRGTVETRRGRGKIVLVLAAPPA